jgi:transposase
MGRPAKYPAEFRAEAVALVNDSDRPLAEVARSLGISDSTLSNWVHAQRRARERAADPDGLSETERAELVRLRKENAELVMERDVLKRSVALWVNEAMGR